MPAFYSSSVNQFLVHSPQLVLGHLTAGANHAGFYQQMHAQTHAWLQQVSILQDALRACVEEDLRADWHLLLEYSIPRRGKRIDAVLLLSTCLVVIEIKCGASTFDRDAIRQLEDYCLDLRDFHRPSNSRVIVPLLLATDGPATPPPMEDPMDAVREVWKANRHDLAEKLRLCASRHAIPYGAYLDPNHWNHGEYAPTPTIVEAAQALYAGHSVREISRCHAGVDNLTATSEAVIRLIADARAGSKKTICFVTGIPGAGKTLAGLNVVHNHDTANQGLGVFLSGNGPLVRVLTEALARDHRDRTSWSLAASRSRVSTFVQNVHRFIDEYFTAPDKVPADTVVVFDEAQRAWNAQQSRRKFKRDFSEPEIMLEVMDRHPSWAVIVALVGVGQEINTGEAGLGEWGRALSDRFSHWGVAVSPELLSETDGNQGLFTSAPADITIRQDAALHLRVPLRSYKGEKLAAFVDAILHENTECAQDLATHLRDYPIVLTRSLEAARQWLKRRQRGTRRTGLIASSGGRRLLAHGLDVTVDLDVENWFLNSSDDVRSSFYLEVPATEFGIQGLELDWVGLCWGGDLVRQNGRWLYRKFRGTQWQQVRNVKTQQYTLNKYRVLLTRAREGVVIWVPPGSQDDSTRPPAHYDVVADFLEMCGVSRLVT